MKNLRTLIAAMATVGLLLYSCSPENVRPTSAEDSQQPSLAGAEGDAHPALDTVCGFSDPLILIREDNGSTTVDKCFGIGGVPIICSANQLPWGSFIMREGYFQGVNYLDCNFSLAPGWFCDFEHWKFGVSNEFNFDNNGLPIVDVDWGTDVVNPALNQWQLRLVVDSLPLPCFDIALRVHALKLSIFGFPINGSQTTLWGQNPYWDIPGHDSQSSSPFLMHFCPERCLAAPDPCQNDVVAPTINCPANATYQCVSDVPALSPAAATATDNCSSGNDLVVTVTESSNGGSCTSTSNLVLTRTFTATDLAGNSSSCTQTITVSRGPVTGGSTSGCNAAVSATFNCSNPNCVTVTSTKDLSNVVLRDCNGTNYKFDGLTGKTATFCHPSGLPVTRVWIKSGCYQSGDGPGYGRRLDNPCNPCL